MFPEKWSPVPAFLIVCFPPSRQPRRCDPSLRRKVYWRRSNSIFTPVGRRLAFQLCKAALHRFRDRSQSRFEVKLDPLKDFLHPLRLHQCASFRSSENVARTLCARTGSARRGCGRRIVSSTESRVAKVCSLPAHPKGHAMTCPASESIRRQVLTGRPVEISRSRDNQQPPKSAGRRPQSPVPELCQNPIVLAHRGLLSEREQVPQVVDNRHFRIEQMECLEPLTVIRNQQVAGSSPAGGSITPVKCATCPEATSKMT